MTVRRSSRVAWAWSWRVGVVFAAILQVVVMCDACGAIFLLLFKLFVGFKYKFSTV